MGRDLRRYLADRLPPGVPAAQRAVALELADLAHDRTGVAFGPDVLVIVARRAGLPEKTVRDALTRLAKVGIEMRVQLGVDKNGAPVFAHRGKQTTYRVPGPDCAALIEPPAESPGVTFWPTQDEKGPPLSGPSEEPPPGGPIAQEGPPLSGPLPVDNSKGPPPGDERASTQRRKGLQVEAPTKFLPKNQSQLPATSAVLDELGATPAEQRRLVEEIEKIAKGPIKNLDAYLATLARNGQLAQVLDDLRRPERDRLAQQRARRDRGLPLCAHDGPPGRLDNGLARCPQCRRTQEAAEELLAHAG